MVSPFNWIDKVMEDMGRKVGRMLDEEAGRDQERNWRSPIMVARGPSGGEVSEPSEKADLGDTITLFEGKNTHV